ncbi:hypothetical protein RRG08_052017 [Elysia crispata]|uniref:Uncharacterized protein n=1 Tax=Elysia crispata TaxID=231223 RepID=A0AAE0Z6W8_9GAST|nr:hypothetical protein RRG08_052017 [Elysia crispata]
MRHGNKSNAQRGHSRDEANRRRSTDAEDPVSPRLVLDLPAEDWSPLREGAEEAPGVKRKRQGRDNAGEDVNFLEGSCSDPTADDSKRRGQQLHDRKGRDREREITTPSPATTLTSSLSDAVCSVRSPGSTPSSTPGPPLFSAPSRQLTPPVGTSSGGGGSGGGACHKYKHSMLQGYLHDASQQAAITSDLDLASRPTRFRQRHLSSSTGSHDFEYLSASSVSSRTSRSAARCLR